MFYTDMFAYEKDLCWTIKHHWFKVLFWSTLSLFFIFKSPKKRFLPASVWIGGQDCGGYKKVVRREGVKEGDIGVYKYEKHVKYPKRITHSKEWLGRTLLTSRELCMKRKGENTTSTETKMVQNHIPRYLKVQSREVELLGAEVYPYYQISSEVSKKQERIGSFPPNSHIMYEKLKTFSK